MKTISFIILVLVLISIHSCNGVTWSSNVSSTNEIDFISNTYSSYTSFSTYQLVAGPVSNAIYTIDYISNPWTTVVKKVLSDNSITWYSAFDARWVTKSNSIDANELNLYVTTYNNPANVIQLSTSTGTMIQANKL